MRLFLTVLSRFRTLWGLGLCALLALPAPAPAQDAADLQIHIWSHPSPGFGGLSALLVEEQGTRLITASDRGPYFTARLIRDASGRITAVQEVQETPLTSHKGVTNPPRFHSDIEGLTRLETGGLGIAFESYSRLQTLAQIGDVPRGTHMWNQFEDLFGNEAFEAIATLPDGRLITFVEGQDAAWTFEGRDGWQGPWPVPMSKDYDITGADLGPDGCLYVVERRFQLLWGFSFRIARLWQDGLIWRGDTDWHREEIFASPRDLGNVEGLAAWEDPNGQIRLTLVTDNGFRTRTPTHLIELSPPHAPCRTE